MGNNDGLQGTDFKSLSPIKSILLNGCDYFVCIFCERRSLWWLPCALKDLATPLKVIACWTRGEYKIMNSLFECIKKKETREEQRKEGKEWGRQKTEKNCCVGRSVCKQVYLACKFITRQLILIAILSGEFVILVGNTTCSFDCLRSHRNCSY